MRRIELKGHSGCSIYLIVSDTGKPFVRKISKSVQYNERLKRQCTKQKEYRSDNAYTPEVFSEGFVDDLYYFDMEYVRGVSVDLLLESCTVDKIEVISSFLVEVVRENMGHISIRGCSKSAIEDKCKAVFANLGNLQNNENIKRTFGILCNHQWLEIQQSYSHGDLTLENVLYSHDNKFYLIDFLDTFYSAWIGDISKILQDLVVGWSFRYRFINTDAISENTKIRVLLLRKQFIDAINRYINNDKVWEDIYLYLLLDLLRIIPYIKDGKIFGFVNKSMKVILDKIEHGDIYEHINCTMCWPIYEISRG